MASTWPTPLPHQIQVLLDNLLLDPPARIEPWPGHTETRAFVLVTTANSQPQPWVDPDDNIGRDIHRLFARMRLGMTAPLDGATWNLDHMCSPTAGALDPGPTTATLGTLR